MTRLDRISLLVLALTTLLFFEGCRDVEPIKEDGLPPATDAFPADLIDQINVDSIVVSRPVIDNNSLLIRTETTLYKLESYNQIQWQVSYPGYLGMFPPVVFDDRIIVPTDIGQFVVLSAKDGSLRWRDEDEVAFRRGHNIEDISVSEDVLVVAKFNSTVTGYDINSGRILWKHALPARSSTYLASYTGKVFVAAGESLVVYELISGNELWTIDFDTFVGPMVETENRLILVLGPPDRTSIVAVDSLSQKILWTTGIDTFKSNAHGSIAAHDNSIFLTGNKVIALSSETGKLLWEAQETGQLGKPIVLDDTIYVRDYDMTIYSLDMNSGEILGTLKIGPDALINDFDRGPAGNDPFLVVPFGDDRVFIYEQH